MALEKQWNDFPLRPEVGPDDTLLMGDAAGDGYRVKGDAVAPKGHRHDNAAEDADGFMSAADKEKLDSIAENANAYEHPTSDGSRHVPPTPAGSTNRWLKSGASAGAMAVWAVITKTDVGLGSVDNTSDVSKPVSTAQQTALNLKEDKSAKGAANGYASLDAAGKIPSNQLPALAITDTFPVANQTAMLALTAQVGDIAIRSDLNKSFVLRVEPATALANWSELLTPTDAVLSVNDKTGAVTLGKADVGLGSVDNTSDANKPVSTPQQAALNAKQNKLTAGPNVTIDNTDPNNPVISSSGGGGGGGTVTSVGLSVPTGLSVDNSPVTGIGTLTISYQAGYQGYTTAEAGKLSGIASGATVNQADAYLLNRANHSGAQAISTITGLTDALGNKADLIGGLIPVGQLPAIAITDSFVVNSQAAMLALAVQVGDIAVRTDLSKTFVLKTEPATVLANWVELLSPTAGVSSVSASGANGLTLNVSNPTTTPAIALGGTLSIAGGGTGATSAGNARIALGAIGVASSNLLTGGVRVTPVTLITSAGAIQPDLSSRNVFLYTNQGAFTLYAPIDDNGHTAVIHVENASGAGAMTPSGFDYVDPDGLALFKTTVGAKFIFQIISGGSGKKCLYIMKASA